MRLSDLELSLEQQEFIRYVCDNVNPISVKVKDENWEKTYEILRLHNRHQLASVRFKAPTDGEKEVRKATIRITH